MYYLRWSDHIFVGINVIVYLILLLKGADSFIENCEPLYNPEDMDENDIDEGIVPGTKPTDMAINDEVNCCSDLH